MSIKVAFVINRDNHYKFIGNIIEQFLKQGHTVYLFHFHDHQTLIWPKGFYFPNLSKRPIFKNDNGNNVFSAIFRNSNHLKEIILSLDISCILCLHPREKYQFFEMNIPWFTVQHGWDIIFDINSFHQYSCDGLFIYNKKMLTGCKKKIDFPVIESGPFHLEHEPINKDDIRFKYGLPNKKMIIYLPFLKKHASFNRIQQMIHPWFRKKERDILSHIKNYCEKQGLLLIIKSRYKMIMEDVYKNYGIVLYDECNYPSTMYELLHLSELVIYPYYTDTVYEAIFFQNKCLKIDYPLIDKTLSRSMRNLLGNEYFFEFYYPNELIKTIHYKKFNQNFLDEYIQKPYSKDASMRYTKSYCFPENHEQGFSESIIQYICKNIS